MQFGVRFGQLPIQTMLKQAKVDIFQWKASKKLSTYISSSFGKKMIFFHVFLVYELPVVYLNVIEM